MENNTLRGPGPYGVVFKIPYFGSKIISAMDDMMLVEKREFFEPEPDEFRLDDEERHSNLFFYGIILVFRSKNQRKSNYF